MSNPSADQPDHHAPDTRSQEYADRLRDLSGARWKQVLDVQRPYRWNLHRQGLGRTLDVGCGIGRNLLNLGAGSVGVDHNAESVAECRARGLEAYTSEEWMGGAEVAVPESFDGMLVAHVLEHIEPEHWEGVVSAYLPYLRPGGKVMMICPQEKGYTTDATHVHFTDGAQMAAFAERLGLVVEKNYSFPFPRFAGRFFPYNEFCLVARKPA
ncbi:class I SAM-dependent methyltransferase [Nocardioides hwasunensis]|uniref:Class I SAM-dependent methyltransferase n=1 Tax=Nocardioides hwasunensis TaxID=397258 RepID=A0ABR8MB73_9ACTN|nr:class I SAM-dependent methyltransferase [Nocardioides hwasunensis]MBD3913113.1 class I SAM-dependent methyltransferase [Nocardioides hwasunensis]